MSRPFFAAAWAASLKIYDASDAGGKVASVVGGNVAKNIDLRSLDAWSNTCAVRMSYILNYSGLLVPRVPEKTVSGADKRWYFFRVRHLVDFLTQRWGAPDLVVPFPPAGGGPLVGKQGVALFIVSGWSDAAGHATLWNGNVCYDHCYFNQPGVRYHTDKANFWSLP